MRNDYLRGQETHSSQSFPRIFFFSAPRGIPQTKLDDHSSAYFWRWKKDETCSDSFLGDAREKVEMIIGPIILTS